MHNHMGYFLNSQKCDILAMETFSGRVSHCVLYNAIFKNTTSLILQGKLFLEMQL